MKLIYESGSDAVFEQELNEATGAKKYKIRGVYSSPGKKNKNGRVYPMHLWEREVAKYQDVIKSGHPNSLMELNHPPYANVNMMEAVAKTTKLWIENGLVMGESVLLDNPKADQLKTLIDNGIKMAVSTRGVGKVGPGGVVEDYNFIAVDIIPNLEQSDHLAEMYGITEGILKDKEYDLNENGDIVEICCKDKCLREHRPQVNKAILSIFDTLFEHKINEVTDVDELTNKYNKVKELLLSAKKYEANSPMKTNIDEFISFLAELKKNY